MSFISEHFGKWLPIILPVYLFVFHILPYDSSSSYAKMDINENVAEICFRDAFRTVDHEDYDLLYQKCISPDNKHFPINRIKTKECLVVPRKALSTDSKENFHLNQVDIYQRNITTIHLRDSQCLGAWLAYRKLAVFASLKFYRFCFYAIPFMALAELIFYWNLSSKIGDNYSGKLALTSMIILIVGAIGIVPMALQSFEVYNLLDHAVVR